MNHYHCAITEVIYAVQLSVISLIQFAISWITLNRSHQMKCATPSVCLCDGIANEWAMSDSFFRSDMDHRQTWSKFDISHMHEGPFCVEQKNVCFQISQYLITMVIRYWIWLNILPNQLNGCLHFFVLLFYSFILKLFVTCRLCYLCEER